MTHQSLGALVAFSLACLQVALPLPVAAADTACKATVYLTLDTGNMSQAERIAGILKEQGVRATFFLANEKTPRGDSALDPSWRDFWRARVAEGHAFGSHTFDHVYFRDPARGAPAGSIALARPQFGDRAGQASEWNAAQVCEVIERVDARFREMTGRSLDRFWRAPGGKAPAAVLEAARHCGYRHVYWSPAGFLGDELSSEKYPNAQLLAQSLRTIRDGDILMMHLGIWSRHDPYAPTLEPLIVGLKQRGTCFATLRDYPGATAAGGPTQIPAPRP